MRTLPDASHVYHIQIPHELWVMGFYCKRRFVYVMYICFKGIYLLYACPFCSIARILRRRSARTTRQSVYIWICFRICATSVCGARIYLYSKRIYFEHASIYKYTFGYARGANDIEVILRFVYSVRFI